MRLSLILMTLFALYGCQEKLEESCAEANCAVSDASQAVDIEYSATYSKYLAVYTTIAPVTYTTHENSFSCSIPQALIDAGFSISPACVIYGTPLKTISGIYKITILDFETSEDKSVNIDLTVVGGSGCGVYGNEVTIEDYPSVSSPDFSFCVDSSQYIRDVASDLAISLPGNGCQGTCTASLAELVSGTLDQNEQTAMTVAQVAANFVLFDVAYPTSDLTLNLTPDQQAFCLLSLVPCPP